MPSRLFTRIVERKRMSESVAKEAQPRAQCALRESPIFDLRHVLVEQVEDSLYISGSVTSFYHKQLAQEIVRAVSNGADVVNSISVVN